MTVRAIRPTDLAALLLFLGHRPSNKVQTRRSLGKKEGGLLPLSLFFESGLPVKRKRHSLVCVSKGLIQGLVSARSRSGPRAWEIDRLLLAEGHEDVGLDLLQKMSIVGGQRGVEKVFLRLANGSPVVDVARDAGFILYLTEFLYQFNGKVEQVPRPSSLRPRSGGDEYGLFQLYSAVVPAAVRSVEGMTLYEWRESRYERAKREFVYEKDGRLRGWLRIDINGRAGNFEIMAQPLEEDGLDWLVKYSLALLKGKLPILCLAPEFLGQLRQLLLRQNFEVISEYATMVKQIAARVPEPSLMPARA